MSNYPDDIRQYDHDPRSPFYENKEEKWLEQRAEEIAEDWQRMDEAMGEHDELREKFMRFLTEAYLHHSESDEYKDAMAMAWSAWNDMAEAAAEDDLSIEGLPEPDEDEPRRSMFHRRQAD